MTEIEILRMARQSGIDSVQQYDSDTSPIELLVRFADRVAQHEREACANVAEQVGQYKNQHGIAAAIRARGQA